MRRVQWRSQPKNLVGAKKIGGAKMFDFRRITLFCLEKRLSKHKMTIFSKNSEGDVAPLPHTGYAYGSESFYLFDRRSCFEQSDCQSRHGTVEIGFTALS